MGVMGDVEQNEKKLSQDSQTLAHFCTAAVAVEGERRKRMDVAAFPAQKSANGPSCA
jgi:hypothetical protein